MADDGVRFRHGSTLSSGWEERHSPQRRRSRNQPGAHEVELRFGEGFRLHSLVAETPNLLVVHPSLPARNLKELIAISKKNPRQLNYASGGTGTTVHLSGELFQHLTGVKSPDLRERLIAAGADPVGSSAEEYAAFVQGEIAKWGKVIAAAGRH